MYLFSWGLFNINTPIHCELMHLSFKKLLIVTFLVTLSWHWVFLIRLSWHWSVSVAYLLRSNGSRRSPSSIAVTTPLACRANYRQQNMMVQMLKMQFQIIHKKDAVSSKACAQMDPKPQHGVQRQMPSWLVVIMSYLFTLMVTTWKPFLNASHSKQIYSPHSILNNVN